MEPTFEQIQEQRQLIRDEVGNLIKNSEWEVEGDDEMDGYIYVTIYKKANKNWRHN